MKQQTHQDSVAYRIIEKLCDLNRIFCSTDYDTSIEYLKEHLPFQIHEYRSSEPHKGWVIPPKWDLVKAIIKHKGKTILEVKHPLEIVGLSTSFQGKISLNELKKHLHYDHRNPKRIPYHFRQHYRPWERDWGFCVTQEFYDSLADGEYDVQIQTKESEGYLKVAEYIHHGTSPIGFAFVAHLDHPGMANDDLAGVAVGIELFEKLSKLKTKFTYRLVLVQEIIGSVFYLDETMSDKSNKPETQIIESCFLEMLGSKTPLALQASQMEKSRLEVLLERTLKDNGITFRKGEFRSIVCNDEIVWESHGIPMCSLSRYPYPEYHSNFDNLSIISHDSLSEAVENLHQTVLKLENEILITKNFEGVYSLAHPNYGLYVDPGQPAFGDLPSESVVNLRCVMDNMSLYPKYIFLDSIAEKLNIPHDVLLGYLRKWEKHHLISLL